MAQFALRNATHAAHDFANAVWHVTCTIAVAVPEALIAWQTRAQARGALRLMDERLLRDMGIDRAEAFHEANKPFWKA